MSSWTSREMRGFFLQSISCWICINILRFVASLFCQEVHLVIHGEGCFSAGWFLPWSASIEENLNRIHNPQQTYEESEHCFSLVLVGIVVIERVLVVSYGQTEESLQPLRARKYFFLPFQSGRISKTCKFWAEENALLLMACWVVIHSSIHHQTDFLTDPSTTHDVKTRHSDIQSDTSWWTDNLNSNFFVIYRVGFSFCFSTGCFACWTIENLVVKSRENEKDQTKNQNFFRVFTDIAMSKTWVFLICMQMSWARKKSGGIECWIGANLE